MGCKTGINLHLRSIWKNGICQKINRAGTSKVNSHINVKKNGIKSPPVNNWLAFQCFS